MSDNRFTPAKAKEMFLKFWNPNLDVDLNNLSVMQQDLLNRFLQLWRFKIVMILVNIFGALIYLIYETGVVTFILALLVLPFFIPLYYYTWFRSLHKALSSNSSLSYIWFFLTFAIHILIALLWALGTFPGTVGWIVAGKGGHGAFYAIVMFSLSVVYTLYLAASVYLIIQVHSMYRTSGASVAQARNEMTNAAAQTAAQSAVSSPTSVNIQVTPKY